MKIGIHGINGKMGQAIAQAISFDRDCELASASVRASHAWYNQPLKEVSSIKSDLKPTANLEVLCQKSEVIVDFTRPDALIALLPLLQRYNRPVVIGTTGLNKHIIDLVQKASKNIPIVLAPNTSLGVAVLMESVKRAAAALGADKWDCEIFEAHHRRKADAPSGTAIKLGEVIAQAREQDFDAVKKYPHESTRKTGDIGFSSVRGGDIVGEHIVYFINEFERLEFSHKAQDRSIFAFGALTAAKWLVKKQEAGLYGMADVLGFND